MGIPLEIGIRALEGDQAKKDIIAFSQAELSLWAEEQGENTYRGRQIYEWLHLRHAISFDEMTNLPKRLRNKLKEDFTIITLDLVKEDISAKGESCKFLYALSDGNIIESVMMRYRYGLSVCISSQVGCRMGCLFCASGIGGKVRNLTAGEMLAQVRGASLRAGERVGHIVVMGSGEPLDNYDNLVRFLKIISDLDGEGVSLRNITVSTCGIVPNIYRLAKEGFPVTLALSLHAPTSSKRKRFLPVERKYPLPSVMEAVRYYFKNTGRRITFEYCCVEGENIFQEDAERLCGLVSGINCHINLIPLNPIKERPFTAPGYRKIEVFRSHLEKNGIHVTIRREMGRDINGACGQLRRGYMLREN